MGDHWEALIARRHQRVADVRPAEGEADSADYRCATRGMISEQDILIYRAQ